MPSILEHQPRMRPLPSHAGVKFSYVPTYRAGMALLTPGAISQGGIW